MTDEEIVRKWRQAIRMHSKPSQIAKLIALQMADELEKDGVTEVIDRLFPERKALTAAPASAEPVGWQHRRKHAFLDQYPKASEYVMQLYSTEYEARVASL